MSGDSAQGIKDDIQKTFEDTVGHGNFTIRGWTSTMGISLPSGIRLRKLLFEVMSVVQLLMVLNFLKEYRHETAAALSFGYRSEATYEKYIWSGLELLDYYLPEVLSLPLSSYSCQIQFGR